MPLHIRRILLGLILLLALGLRLWRIDTLPPGFHFDESFEGLEAWHILKEPTYRPLYLSGNFGVPPLNAYANALTFAVFERFGGTAGPTAMRVTAAFFGVLGVLAVYAVATELQRLEGSFTRLSPAFPLFAGAVLAVMRWHLHFSRMGIEPILTPLLWAASTWLLLHSWRTGRWWSAAGCGVLLAASTYAYRGAWIIPLLAVVTSLILIGSNVKLKKRGAENGDSSIEPESPRISNLQSLHLGQLLLAATVASLLVAPLGRYFWQHPDQLLMRLEQIAVVGNGGAAASHSVGEMAWATVKMFGPFGSPGDQDPRRNLPGAAALDLWLAIPFYLGLAVALLHVRRPAYAILVTSLVGLLLPGVFSEYAPHFHRVLGAAAPAALLCGVGLDWMWSVRPARFAQTTFPSAALRWASIVLLLLGAVGSARDYFVRWAALPDLFYAFDAGLWSMGRQIAALPPDTPVYLTPRDVSDPTLAFALQTQPGGAPQVASFDGRHIFPLTAAANRQPEYYAVIDHEDFRTSLLLPELFPTATVAAQIDDPWGKVYGRLLERPAATLPQRSPQHALVVAIGDGIHLAGYDVQPATLMPGQILYLQLYWQVEAAPTGDWTVFTHLVRQDAGGGRTVVAGHDSPPGEASLPTIRWQAGWRVLDESQIPLPADLAPGIYELEIGLYQADGEHLPADRSGVNLGKVKIG